MQVFKKALSADVGNQKGPLHIWRERIFFAIFSSGILFGLASYVSTLRYAITRGHFSNSAIFYTSVYICAIVILLVRPIPFAVRAGIGLFLFYILELATLLTVGPMGTGSIWLFSFAITAALLLGLWAGLIASAFNLCTLFILAQQLNAGRLNWLLTMPYTLDTWNTTLVTFAFLNCVIVISLAVLVRNLEKALRQSEEKYKTILENIEEGYYEVDLQGTFTLINDALCRTTGYSRDDLIGKNSRDHVDPEDIQKVHKAFNRVYSTVEPEQNAGWQILRPDGSRRDVEASVSLVRSMEGQPVGFRGIIRDVTERKLAEENKKRLEAQIQIAQRLESLGTLAGGIAHDFNNILMGIQGRASLMLMNIDESYHHFEHLKVIEDYVQHAADLTKQLLGLARGGKYEVKPVNLNDIVSRTSEMFGRTKKEIIIHSTYQDDIWIVEVDRRQIEQVLLNMYVNAWQAMPEGGEIFLETRNVIIDEGDSISCQVDPGRYVKISVTDVGVGMDEATRRRIFDPFFTTKEMGRGSGLGLASAYGIIKNHGGFINVFSEKGRGTTFDVYLKSTEKEAGEQKAQRVGIEKGSETVLLVDDEEMITEVLKELLEALGYTVLLAGNGIEATETYRTCWEKIDIVILDMIMPGMSGRETFDRLKRVNPEMKVVLSSGYSMNGQAKEILNRECNDFIQKPIKIADLSRKLRKILDDRPQK